MDSQNIPSLRKEFETKKKEAASLRTLLQTQNKEKEAAFQELRSIRTKVQSQLALIAPLKKERDSITKEVKRLKQEREKLNKEVQQHAGSKPDFSKRDKSYFEKKESPSQLKREIQKIETKIETEVIPYKQEEKLRKQIKDMKARYKVIEVEDAKKKESQASASHFIEARRKAQDSHHKIQQKAQESQEKHEKINEIYEKIKTIRDQEKPLAQTYLSLKEKHTQTKTTLDGLQKEIKELSKLFDDVKEERFKDKVKKKTAEVKEKMKKGKKLSTEDILAFQAIKE